MKSPSELHFRRVMVASHLCVRWHDGQFRRAAGYATHPFKVAEAAYRSGFAAGWDLDDLVNGYCAALLHDVLEDTQCPPQLIRDTVGMEVLEYVEQMTLPPDKRKPPEKLQYQLEKMRSMDMVCATVKICDKLDNMTDMVENPPLWSPAAIQAYVTDSTTLVEAGLARLLECPGNIKDLLTSLHTRRSAAYAGLQLAGYSVEIRP